MLKARTMSERPYVRSDLAKAFLGKEVANFHEQMGLSRTHTVILVAVHLEQTTESYSLHM